MDITLNKYRWKSYLVCLDDNTIFSKNNDQHLKNIEDVLSTLYAADVPLKLKRSHSFTTKKKFLGRTITSRKLSITEARTRILKSRKHPRTQTKLRSFLGM